MKIKYDAGLMKLMSYFESATGATLKDCFVDSLGILNFVVGSNMGYAIGRNGETARRLQSSLKRKIRIFSFSEDLAQFVANLLMPLKVKSVEVAGSVVIITPEPESRGYIIGRSASSLRNYESIVGRYFDVKELRVL